MKKNHKSIHQKKELLRKKLEASLKKISASRKKSKSKRLAIVLTRSLFFKRARKVLVYAAQAHEVATRPIIQKALASGKRVYLPKVIVSKRRLELYEIRALKDLKRGYRGILEPRALKSRKATLGQMDLVIVPGLGFNRRGARLGRGGGYYDRLLAKPKKAHRVGIAFREQICRSIPMTRRDQPVDRVVTD